MGKMIFAISLLALTVGQVFSAPNDSNWVQLLRQGDTSLSDWIVKIQGQTLGANPYRTFSYAQANDGSPRLIVTDTVNYANNYGFGHLFYKTPFSDYLLRAQFHFPSKASYALTQGTATGKTWTIQNNGLMLHCQSPSSMSVSQAYPNSFENQLLGYWNGGATGGFNPPDVRSSNLCLPQSTVYYNNGSPAVSGTGWFSDGSGHHCTAAKPHSLAYDTATIATNGANSTNANWLGKDIWQYAMARVLDSTSMTFFVRNRPDTAWDSVMSFSRPHYGNASSLTNLNGATVVTSGYISIQMEGTTTEFAKIELLNLVGCKNPADTSYRAYFVKDSSTTKCSGVTTNITGSQRRAQGTFFLSGNRIQATNEIINVEVFDLNGTRIMSLRGTGRSFLDVSNLKPGLYTLRVQTSVGLAQAVYAKM